MFHTLTKFTLLIVLLSFLLSGCSSKSLRPCLLPKEEVDVEVPQDESLLQGLENFLVGFEAIF